MIGIKDKRCITCEYWVGKREFKNGRISDGGSFGKSTCSKDGRSCGNGFGFGCYKYKQWSAIELYLLQEQKKKEQKDYQRQLEWEKIHQDIDNNRRKAEHEKQHRELERERERLEYERRLLEKERERLEYEKWYSSLTPEQRKEEDDRKKKEEEERQLKAEEQKRQAEKERIEYKKMQRRKGLISLLSIVVGILILIGIIEIINSTKNYRYAYRKLKRYDDETYEIKENIGQATLDYYIYADDRNNLYAQITCVFNDDSFGYQELGAYIEIEKGKVKNKISVSLKKDKNKKYTIDAEIKFYGVSFEKYPTISFSHFEIEKGNLTNEQINFCKTLVLELYNKTNDFFLLANPKKPLFPQ